MSVVWDTSVIIDVLRGRAEALRYADGLDEPPFVSEISRVEVLRGVRESERTATERFFSGVRWVPLDETVARRAGELGREWGPSHPGISSADLIVASTADVLGASLATLNIRHFPIRGLRPPYAD